MIKVTNEVPAYERDGECTASSGKGGHLKVCSHWENRDWVVICIGPASITVHQYDLKKALQNASNSK